LGGDVHVNVHVNVHELVEDVSFGEALSWSLEDYGSMDDGNKSTN
jgi:hypothetical protein